MNSLDPRIEDAFAREVPARVEFDPDWEDIVTRAGCRRHPAPRRWRPVLVAAVVTAALAGAGVAIAAGLGAFEGTPAPPGVSANFSFYNQMADYAVQQGFSGMSAHADVSKAHGVIEVQTPDGPEDLWSHPTTRAASAGSSTSPTIPSARAGASPAAAAAARPRRRRSRSTQKGRTGRTSIQAC
jgi:hypothetical protein